MKCNKRSYATVVFNLIVLDYKKNQKVTKFLNLTFKYGLVPVINKLTRYTKTYTTTTDHIVRNSLLHKKIDTEIIKLDISDHFPTFLIARTEKRMSPEGKVQITKHLIK